MSIIVDPPPDRQDEARRADHFQALYEAASAGRCGPSGLTLSDCKRSDICDCFDFEWVRPGGAA